MKRVFLTLVLLLSLALTGTLSAQAIKDVRINEVLVINEDNYEDDYGHREGWIELFNSGFSKVDLGGCYLSVGDSIIYRIPKGDPRTEIAPQGYIIFYAEGTATKGTFHTNFTLDKTGYIALYDQSGRGEPISEVKYNLADQKADVSIGFMTNADSELEFIPLDATTPNATNEIVEAIPAHEKFRMLDPVGIVMALTAMSVVFAALALLYIVFRTIGKIMVGASKKKEPKVATSDASSTPVAIQGDITAEELAAIAIALKQYEDDLHDIESNVITINKVARAYSPWSSKIYGLRQLPNKNK